jgi:UDP-N-acetylmuramoylalanine--D-glutamate ligase
LVADVDAVLPSPGIPDRHPVFALAEASDRPVLSEYDLARNWDDRPVIAITGTDGKTTVTTLVHDMLVESGQRAVACGNNELPLVSALEREEPEVFVVEASSFQLGHTQRIEPKVATWLNFAPDHLDVHRSLGAYETAKAKPWPTVTTPS